MLTVTMYDEHLQHRGQILSPKVQAVMRKNQPDTFVIDVVGEALKTANRIMPGWWLTARDGDIEISGPVTAFHRTAKGSELTLEITVTSALCLIADRITYPDPAHAENAQETARYTRSGPGESIIKELVNLNTGGGAIHARRISTLDIAEDRRRGGTVQVDTRLKNLLETTRPLADTAGLIMRCGLKDRRIVFETEPVRDLSRRVRLSYMTGEVAGWEMEDTVGTATAVVVGGQGEGADRKLTSVVAGDHWNRRIELFKDRRDTDDAAALEKSAHEELAKGATTRTLKVTLNESPARRFGDDFRIGDTITLDLAAGATPYTAPVVEAKITWESQARTVELTVGDLERTNARFEKVRRDLAQLSTI